MKFEKRFSKRVSVIQHKKYLLRWKKIRGMSTNTKETNTKDEVELNMFHVWNVETMEIIGDHVIVDGEKVGQL